jgi:hypothetical protein
MQIRQYGFPEGISEPIWFFADDVPLKSHPAYRDAKSGNIAAAVELVADLGLELSNAGRLKNLRPQPKILRQIIARHELEIEKTLRIAPCALTANEADYLIGFRTADEIRNRLAKARKETDLRLLSKGIEE